MSAAATLQLAGEDPAVTATMAGTVSGRLVDLLAPDWTQIDLADIAHGLSLIRRWSGQTRRPISVAEHSLLVARLVPSSYRLAAVMHDAHEALFGDFASPSASALDQLVGGRVKWALDEIKHRLDVAIARAALEAFAPKMSSPIGAGLSEHARWIAADMRADTVRGADLTALRYEAAVRRRDSLQRLDVFGEQAILQVPPWAPDESALTGQWLGEVKALVAARFAGRSTGA